MTNPKKDLPVRRDPAETANVRQTAVIGGAKPKRDRSWDAAHSAEVATYRIGETAKLAISDISQEVGVSTSDIARAFIEHGITAYKKGILKLSPLPVGKKTLFPKQ